MSYSDGYICKLFTRTLDELCSVILEDVAKDPVKIR